MERQRPITTHSRNIPVNVYKNDKLMAACESIQEAARWLKQDSNDANFRWTKIHESIAYDCGYSRNGATYYFVSTEEYQRNRRKWFEEKNPISLGR